MLGTTAAMLTYLGSYAAALLALAHWPLGTDQGLHNKLIYTGKVVVAAAPSRPQPPAAARS